MHNSSWHIGALKSKWHVAFKEDTNQSFPPAQTCYSNNLWGRSVFLFQDIHVSHWASMVAQR